MADYQLTLILQPLVTFEEMSVMAVTKSFYIEIAFVTAIGDIFTHVTAIGDPWVSNGCDKSAHTTFTSVR